MHYSCANPVALGGGDKDTTPPKVVADKSTPNPSLNFKEDKVEITYDEWVVLKDAFNQVVISPPLENRPSIRLKGKTVVVKFDEADTLKENTTYIINFGDAIQDLNEGNIPPDSKFVFSTGPVLDSLSTSGTIMDALTGKPAENVLVMLYENAADSVVRTERPYYFAKTDKQGNFKMDYLRAGEYKAFALLDNNYNYLFDLPNEKIGFPDSLITITDSSQVRFSLQLFEEDPPLQILDEETKNKGFLKFIFNRSPKGIRMEWAAAPAYSHYEVSNDSLLVWYQDVDTTATPEVRFSLPREDYKDTVSFKAPSKNPKYNALKISPSQRNIRLSPKDSLILEFNRPIGKLDTAAMSVIVDSVAYAGAWEARIMDNPRKVFFDVKIKEETKCELKLLPEAVKDIFGRGIDTTACTAQRLPAKEFGDLKIQVSVPDSTLYYLIKITDANKKILDEYTHPPGSSISKKHYALLSAGKYKVTVIEDVNANGRQDSGNYDERRQPERVFEQELEELRKNWELDAEVKVIFR